MKKMKKAVENRRDSIVKLIPKQHNNNNNDIITLIKEGKFLCILLNYCFRKFKTR